MCRAKSESGRRCLGHIRKQKTHLQQQLMVWQIEVQRREKIVEQQPTSRNRRDLQVATTRVETTHKKIDEVLLEETKAEMRKQEQAEAKAKQPVSQRKNKELGAYLKPGEWAELEAQARDYNIPLSTLVRKRLNEPPYIENVLSGVKTRVQRKGHHSSFRDATEGVNDAGMYQREKRRIRTTEATNQRLTEEAFLFGLTRSDYARCLLLDIDPRTFGYHLGDDQVEANTRMFRTAEESNGVSSEDVKGFWLERVGQVRNKYA